jgi:threonyl-tRNA synthetase
VLTIGDEEPLVNYAKAIVRELRGSMVRAEGDYGTDKINGKVQRAEQSKVHTMLVVGPRDMDANAVSIRVHGKGNQGVKPRNEAIAGILQSIAERQA